LITFEGKYGGNLIFHVTHVTENRHIFEILTGNSITMEV